MRVKLSLAGQFLVLQLVIVLLVVVVVGGVSLAQSSASFQVTEGRRLQNVAETVAAMPTVRSSLTDPTEIGLEALPAIAETRRGYSAASYVLIADEGGTLLIGPRAGEPVELGDSRVLSGKGWVGIVSQDDATSLVAHAPVFDDHGEVVGMVVAGRVYPSWYEQLVDATPNLVLYLLLGGLLGVAGSLALSRRVKRQTFGLEPREIAGLAEHREAMLHGIREGVLGLDPGGRITLANDEALRLLRLSHDAVGRDLRVLDVEPDLVEVLLDETAGPDRIVVREDQVLVLNRMPIEVRGRDIGAVATLRDRTELIALQRELDVTRGTTETLRAQAHEFTNRLHTIAGLIELGEYDEVARYVHRASRAHDELVRTVASRIADPSLAALLVAKASLAAEHGVRFRLADHSTLPLVDEQLSADLVTVAGNLVDNALDAVGQDTEGWVEVEIEIRDGEVAVVVRDSGPGVAPGTDVFRRGYTTKPGSTKPRSTKAGSSKAGSSKAGSARPGEQGHLGLGLALSRLICTRRGGDLTVHNEAGAVFTARIPTAADTPTTAGSPTTAAAPATTRPEVTA